MFVVIFNVLENLIVQQSHTYTQERCGLANVYLQNTYLYATKLLD